MARKDPISVDAKEIKAMISNVNVTTWEPFIAAGESVGEVHWLRNSREGEPLLSTGLWRHSPEDHPEGMPYGVESNEMFYVVEGEAELLTNDGEVIKLEEGSVFSASEGFRATWKTLSPFKKFFVVCG